MIKIVRNSVAAVLIFVLFVFCVQFCVAQENMDKIKALQEKILPLSDAKGAATLFEELLSLSIQENQFNETYNFLEGLEKEKVFNEEASLYYYEALTRFRQMQSLEDNKSWQELFDNKEAYAVQISKAIEKADKLNTSLNGLSLQLKFLEAQLNKEDENVFVNNLEDLFNLAREYTNTNSDVQVIKEIADELMADKQTTYARKLYNVYVSQLSKSDISQEELSKIAEGFLNENNIDLAVSLYDVYLDRLASASQDEDKEATIKKMLEVADKFRSIGWQDAKDPFFAEKIYDKINTLYGPQVFDAASQYDRAYNLERIREYDLCLEAYLKLVDNFAQYQDRDRIYFRIGVLKAYMFSDVDEAKKYFLKVINEFPQSEEYFNSLYHLGLLDQWQGNLEKAKESYQLILEKTNDLVDKPEIARMAQVRLQEIEGEKPIEYNLRMFLEAVIKEKQETQRSNLQLDLLVKGAKKYSNENIDFQVSSYLADTGCLQQDFTYLWSGNLGSNQNPFNNDEFKTDYKDDSGTKVVNVVLVGPSGVVGGTVEMVDVYKK